MPLFYSNRISLSRYITIFVVAIILLLGAATIVTVFFQVDAAIRYSQEQNSNREIDTIKGEIESYLDLRRMVLLDHAANPLVVQTVMQPQQNMGNIQDAMDTWQIFQQKERIALLDFAGNAIYANHVHQEDYTASPWINQIINQEKDYHFDVITEDGESFWQIVVPVVYNNLPEGLLVLEVPVTDLYTEEQVSNRIQGMQLDLYGQDGLLASFGQAPGNWLKTVSLSEPELRVVLTIDQSEADEARQTLLWQIIIFLAILSVAAAAVMLYFGRTYLIGPILDLGKMTTHVASGKNINIAQKKQAFLELDDLQQDFAAMARTINSREQALQVAHDTLELRVQERTAELQQEIAWRQQVEESLRESESRNRAMLDANPDLIFRLNRQGEYLDLTAGNEQDLYLPKEQLQGKKISNLLPSNVGDLILQNIAITLETGQMQVFNYDLPLTNGLHTFEARLVKIDNHEVLAFVRNVTQQVRLEQMKTDFINRASHELRTPLTTAIMMVDLLREGGDEDLEEYWQILELELNRQKELIEDLLTVGRLESGTMQLNPRPLDITPLLRTAVKTVTPLAEEKHLYLHANIPADLPLVNADERGMHQVLTNLLGNAIKFTPAQGEIKLWAASNQHGASIFVGDSGIGIPAEDLPHLFDRFYRAQNATTQEIPGSGVGLYIVKSIVEELGGKLSVQSKVDQGTIFEVWLPARQQHTSIEPEEIHRATKLPPAYHGEQIGLPE